MAFVRNGGFLRSSQIFSWLRTSFCRAYAEGSGEVENRSTGKGLSLVVSSLRVDRVAASGLGMGRNKLDNLYRAGNLYLNKKRVTKRSTIVESGDTIDIISREDVGDAEQVSFSRLAIILIGETLTKKDNYHITLKRFKGLALSKEKFEKEYIHVQ